MSQRLTCARGHLWHAAHAWQGGTAAPPAACPVCGAVGRPDWPAGSFSTLRPDNAAAGAAPGAATFITLPPPPPPAPPGHPLPVPRGIPPTAPADPLLLGWETSLG